MSDSNSKGTSSRKQLADQIDRLEGVVGSIDVRAIVQETIREMVPEIVQAVAQAVAQTIPATVAAIVKEVLSNQEIRAAVAPAPAPAEPKPSVLSTATSVATSVAAGVVAGTTVAATAAKGWFGRAYGWIKSKFVGAWDGAKSVAKSVAGYVVSRAILVSMKVHSLTKTVTVPVVVKTGEVCKYTYGRVIVAGNTTGSWLKIAASATVRAACYAAVKVGEGVARLSRKCWDGVKYVAKAVRSYVVEGWRQFSCAVTRHPIALLLSPSVPAWALAVTAGVIGNVGGLIVGTIATIVSGAVLHRLIKDDVEFWAGFEADKKLRAALETGEPQPQATQATPAVEPAAN
jgi:hypothetical protein